MRKNPTLTKAQHKVMTKKAGNIFSKIQYQKQYGSSQVEEQLLIQDSYSVDSKEIEQIKYTPIQSQLSKDPRVSTLRITTPKNQNFVLKFSYSDGCNQIYQNLGELIGKSFDFIIFRAIGGEIDNDSRTLEQVELVPNCRLFVKYL